MTPEQREELKPCPFCGGTAHIDEQPAHSHTGPLAGFMPDYPGSFTVECMGADCNTGQIADTRPDAVSMWNRRAQVEALTVPQWISVEDRLPAPGVLVMVWQPRQEWNYPDDLLIGFDCIDPDDDDAATWRGHNNWYEEYCVIGKPEGSTGPSQDAPYTHWKPMDAAPTIPAIPGTKEGE